jgi:asparagine synthase (glutamine-hydrolysing)
MLEPELPHDVLYRAKMGFAVPLAAWFRGPLKVRLRDALLNGAVSQAGYFEARALERLFRQHVAGQRDNSVVLWSLLMLDAFLRRMDRPVTSPASTETPAVAEPVP